MTETPRDWPLRAALLALAGAGIGLAVHFLVEGDKPFTWTLSASRLALAALLSTAGLAFAFVVERGPQRLGFGFAAVAGLVVASMVYWSGPTAGWSAGEGWRLTCALLTVAIAAPLFQAWRGAGAGRNLPYAAAYGHAWTNVVLWFAALIFVGIAWLLAMLLGELFALIGVDFIEKLLRKDWFIALLTGGAFGGAIGLLRDREHILGTLQRVVTTVLAVLAPVLATGLLAFLLALPFTGLSPLWAATRSTTPIVLSCVIGALILANAVIGDDDDGARRGVLRWSAMGLGAAMLPLGVIAGISTGLRIDQHGLTPERLWAVVFAAVACAYGLAYLVTLVRARGRWAAALRSANLRLGIGLCALAFVLSTPLLSFNAVSTRDQLARLADGRTSAAKFDWAALRFDFGEPGKAAVAQLAQGGTTPELRLAAANALTSTDRWDTARKVAKRTRAVKLDTRFRILPATVPLPPALRDQLAAEELCDEGPRCVLLYSPGALNAVLVQVAKTGTNYRTLAWNADGTRSDGTPLQDTAAAEKARFDRHTTAVAAGQIEVRKVERRQLFVGGEAVDGTFD